MAVKRMVGSDTDGTAIYFSSSSYNNQINGGNVEEYRAANVKLPNPDRPRARTVYVDLENINGVDSDIANGTSSAPFKTIEYAIESMCTGFDYVVALFGTNIEYTTTRSVDLPVGSRIVFVNAGAVAGRPSSSGNSVRAGYSVSGGTLATQYTINIHGEFFRSLVILKTGKLRPEDAALQISPRGMFGYGTGLKYISIFDGGGIVIGDFNFSLNRMGSDVSVINVAAVPITRDFTTNANAALVRGLDVFGSGGLILDITPSASIDGVVIGSNHKLVAPLIQNFGVNQFGEPYGITCNLKYWTEKLVKNFSGQFNLNITGGTTTGSTDDVATVVNVGAATSTTLTDSVAPYGMSLNKANIFDPAKTSTTSLGQTVNGLFVIGAQPGQVYDCQFTFTYSGKSSTRTKPEDFIIVRVTIPTPQRTVINIPVVLPQTQASGTFITPIFKIIGNIERYNSGFFVELIPGFTNANFTIGMTSAMVDHTANEVSLI